MLAIKSSDGKTYWINVDHISYITESKENTALMSFSSGDAIVTNLSLRDAFKLIKEKIKNDKL